MNLNNELMKYNLIKIKKNKKQVSMTFKNIFM